MLYVFYIVASVIFIECFMAMNTGKTVLLMAGIARESVNILKSSATDAEKEKAMQQASIRLLSTTLVLLFKLIIVALVIFALYYLVTFLFPLFQAAILEGLYSLSVLAGLTVFSFAYIYFRNVLQKKL